MKEIEKLDFRPFTKFCMSIGAVPTSYLAGLTIEEQLLWLCSYLEKEVIPAVNNNAEAVEELQGLYIQLKEYVDNYFENLDAQEEINNKLDEMTKSGELAEIISSYLNSQAVFGFDNVSDMVSSKALLNGSTARTYGYYEVNDGGSGLYRIRNVTNEDVIDGGSIIALDNTNLVAELITNGTINIKQYGAKETVNSHYENDISTYLEKCLNKYDEVYIPTGTYYLSSLNMNVSDKKLIGAENANIYTNNAGLVFSGTSTNPYGNRVRRLRIKNIKFFGENRVGAGLTLKYFGECYIDDCYFSGLEKGLYLLNGSEFAMNNTIFIDNTISLDMTKEVNNNDLDAVSINDCAISNSSICVRTESIRGCSFNNTVICNGQNNIGVLICSNYTNSENINFVNCEMEANTKSCIVVGEAGEHTYGLITLNVVNSKLISFDNIPVITINKLQHLNIDNTTFSFNYFPIIEINEYTQNNLRSNINNISGPIGAYIKDNRNDYYGIHIPSKYKKLNFFSDMSRSVLEYSISTEPTFNNNKIIFSGNGFIEFPLQTFNYEDIRNEIYVVVRGQNLGNISYIDGTEKSIKPGNTIQVIGEEEIRARRLDTNNNATAIRINVKSGTVISMIEIYGNNKQPLPICPFTTINANRIGNIKIGDTVVFTSSSLNYHLGVWNGSSFNTL